MKLPNIFSYDPSGYLHKNPSFLQHGYFHSLLIWHQRHKSPSPCGDCTLPRELPSCCLYYSVEKQQTPENHEGAPESSLPLHDALKARKSKPVNGKPQTMATIPATTDCHFTKPNTKSTTAQIEKKARGVGVHLASIMLHPRQFWRLRSQP
jgi:hypothetical protein